MRPCRYGCLVHQIMNDNDKLIRLVGRDFRSTEVECTHCCWIGLAGQLIVPDSRSLGQGVVHACPTCDKEIARHRGLSLEEINAELDEIRAELDGLNAIFDGCRKRGQFRYSSEVRIMYIMLNRMSVRLDRVQNMAQP